MTERLLTPSKITAWLECAHSLNLRNQVESGIRDVTILPLNPLARLLNEKGNTHERNCLSDLENQGKSIYFVPGRNPSESFAQWVERIGNPMEMGHDVIYQMPFVHEGVRGIADFLVKVKEPEEGYAAYEPVDAKLTRTEGKPGHVLQLCFYGDALESLLGLPPREMHLWLGSGATESLLVEQFRPYWRRLRQQLDAVLETDISAIATSAEPCRHCEICDFQSTCEQEWRERDSLVYVANIRQADRQELETAGVRTIVELSQRVESVPDVHDENLRRLSRQANLQVQSRANPDRTPVYEIVAATDDPIYGHGFELLPQPDDGDIFFDFEGHPFWSSQNDLMFLAGLHLQDAKGVWSYEERWAHDLRVQDKMIHDLVHFFADRREQFPDMHVYHYNHTERSAIERLIIGSDSEGLFASLVDTGLFVDLYNVVRNGVAVGTESYGLKHLERLAEFHRHAGIEMGAGAVVEYDEWMNSGDPALLRNIALYNADDVAATKALRDWLVDVRPEGIEWREATLEVEPYPYDTDELVEKLKATGEDTPEALLADLLTYWRRERTAYMTPKFAEAMSDFTTLYGNRDYLANLSFLRFDTETTKKGVVKTYAVFSYPDQLLDQSWKRQSSVLYVGPGVEHGFGYISEIDRDAREIKMTWKEYNEELGGMPATMTLNGYVSPREKPGVLFHLGEQLVTADPNDPPSRVSMALLKNETPRFEEGFGPREGVFSDDLADTLSWVSHLDGSYVAVQGPPGTGKTYSGAHIIYQLITAGKRVGITAMSHAAIDNLMSAAYEVFEEKGELDKLKIVRKDKRPADGGLAGVRYGSNDDCADPNYNLVAGTTWLFSRPEMRPAPVDVLLIDEAGQLALADAIAAANAAHNLILLGDPLQLAQVSQAEHPGGSGASVLEHVLGGNATIPETEGVFLAVTRRMHPDVCDFISKQIYEGRLTSHESCAVQGTDFGTGLRWLRADHRERSTEAVEEMEIVKAQILQMLGTSWTDQRGESSPLVANDFMVVAPYNDQVRLMRREFERDPQLAEVQIGTVDKFQGREAPVVFFTMTTSSGEDMPRGPEFLFSRNRLNVAVSRARCLAYLVCTDELLNARARTIEEMRLVGTLCAFVESATVSTS